MSLSLEQLKSFGPRVRLQAVSEMAKKADPAHAALLIGVLDDPDPEVRKAAAAGLGAVGDRQAIESLVTLLMDNDDSVKDAADQALARIDAAWPQSEEARRSIPALQAALQNDNYWLGLAAANILKRIQGEESENTKETDKTTLTDRFYYERHEAARILASALKDADADMRLAAAETLGRMGNVGFTEALFAALSDPDEWVRWHAAHSLQAIGWQPADDLQKAALWTVLRRWDEVEALGESAVPSLLIALHSGHAKIREAAAVVLGKIRSPQAELPLADLLLDKNKNVRRAAAKALSLVGTGRLNPEQKRRFASELHV